jgi:hypothetical protein
MRTQVTILAWLHIVLGGLTLLLGVAALLLFGGIAGFAAA